LEITTPGIFTFDPKAFGGVNKTEESIFHFTTIHVAAGVTVRLSSNESRGPIFWLAEGPVEIEGTLDLSGGDGDRLPSLPGAGGYSGGAVRKPGYGPLNFTPNIFLVPLVGGSGGDGGPAQGGGAGGGALLIASSTSIYVNGTIVANGGGSTDGIGGNGGAIRLSAPLIEGSGTIMAKGGLPRGKDGFIRFESYDDQFAGSVNDTPFAKGKPLGLFLPSNAHPSVRVVSIDGVAVTTPKFTVTQSSSRTYVAVEAHNIPPGAVIQLQFFTENGSEETVTTTPLDGTFEFSRASASVTFQRGVSHVYVKSNWKQPPQ
jgi:hypothetical protein